jgi:hypothetical protein
VSPAGDSVAVTSTAKRREKWVRGAAHPSRLHLGGNFRHQLHAPGFGFLVEWRQPFAAFLLPNRRGENLPRLLFAFTSCVLRRRVRHDDRVFIEPHIGEIGEREAFDDTSRVSHTFQNLLLALEYPSIGYAYGVVRGKPFHGLGIWSFHACQPAFSLLSSAFSTVAFICENNGTADNSRAKPSAVKAIRRIFLLWSFVVTRNYRSGKEPREKTLPEPMRFPKIGNSRLGRLWAMR